MILAFFSTLFIAILWVTDLVISVALMLVFTVGLILLYLVDKLMGLLLGGHCD